MSFILFFSLSAEEFEQSLRIFVFIIIIITKNFFFFFKFLIFIVVINIIIKKIMTILLSFM